MKNNSLKNTIEALRITNIETPRRQAVLKRTLLRYEAPKRTLFTRIGLAAKNNVGVVMSHKKISAGMGGAAIVAVLMLSVAVYSYNHSPQAQAAELINRGISAVQTFGSSRISQIQSQIGGDPVEELEKAKNAKDVQIITKEELEAESKKHKGVIMSSLGTDGPQFGSVSVGISADGSLPPVPPEGAVTHVSAGTPISGEARFVKSREMAESGESSAPTETRSATGGGIQSNGQPPAQLPEIPTPATYLRYTDNTNHVVVLGLDEQGVPVTKTVFMNDDDVQPIRVLDSGSNMNKAE